MAIRYVDVDPKTGKVVTPKAEPARERPETHRSPVPPKVPPRGGRPGRGAPGGK